MKLFTEQWFLNLMCTSSVVDHWLLECWSLFNTARNGKCWWHTELCEASSGWTKALRTHREQNWLTHGWIAEVVEWEDNVCTSIIVLVYSCCYNDAMDWWLISKGNLLLTVLETGLSRLKVLADWVSGEVSSSWMVPSHCVLTMRLEGTGEFCGVSSIKQ